VIEMKMAEEHEPDTSLFRQGEPRANRTTVQKQGVVYEESATLLADRLVHCAHETIGPMATQHSNLHVVTTID
jgi:hypothetical protein